ncbi:MAG: DNA repair protein RecO [Nannocystaceae bacterium]|nr:DNA repair protein RecO [bacterium]
MSQARTPAVVLQASPLGEADLMVVLLTPDLGKIRTAAKNARNSKRRFAGGLPAGALGEATVSRRREGAMWRLDAFRSVAEVSGLGRDLTRFAYVNYLCELTDVLVVEPEPEARRFAALAEAVGETLRSTPRPAVMRRFELRLLDSLGLLPALDHCCVCGEPTSASEIAFSSGRGGTLCVVHGAGSPRVPAQTLALAIALQRDDDPESAWDAASAASPAVRRALRDLVQSVVRPQLRRPLRSLEFLAALTPRGAVNRTPGDAP